MIGVDLVYIPEFKKQMDLGHQPFIDRTFTNDELTNLNPEHLAGIWAAKEAVFKASDDKKPLSFNKIPISKDSRDKLSSVFAGNSYSISISHNRDYVVAVAIKLESEV